MDDFYALLDQQDSLSLKDFERGMKKLILKDSYFFDPYITLSDVYEENEQFRASELILDKAYGLLVERISDDNGIWPDRMEWGWLENRHMLRLLEKKAIGLWIKEEKVISLDIYRKILQMNPRDNQGVRDCVLALRLGFSYEEFMEKIENSESHAIHEWFKSNRHKFKDEFRILDEGGFED